jgi:hypothetical protein
VLQSSRFQQVNCYAKYHYWHADPVLVSRARWGRSDGATPQRKPLMCFGLGQCGAYHLFVVGLTTLYHSSVTIIIFQTIYRHDRTTSCMQVIFNLSPYDLMCVLAQQSKLRDKRTSVWYLNGCCWRVLQQRASALAHPWHPELPGFLDFPSHIECA